MNKLDNQQLKNISKLCDTRSCILNADSKQQEKNLINQIKCDKYTHVLLNSEQTVLKTFQDALSQPELQSKIDLVVIDECHLIKQ